jgi:hypothetical protein
MKNSRKNLAGKFAKFSVSTYRLRAKTTANTTHTANHSCYSSCDYTSVEALATDLTYCSIFIVYEQYSHPTYYLKACSKPQSIANMTDNRRDT